MQMEANTNQHAFILLLVQVLESVFLTCFGFTPILISRAKNQKRVRMMLYHLFA